MSDSVWPHRWQPTRLCHPWDSPGKNTGVGCHFLLQCMNVKSKSEVTQSCLSVRNPMDWSLPGSSVHGVFQARVLEWVAIAFSESSILQEKKKKNGSVWLVVHEIIPFFSSFCPQATPHFPAFCGQSWLSDWVLASVIWPHHFRSAPLNSLSSWSFILFHYPPVT